MANNLATAPLWLVIAFSLIFVKGLNEELMAHSFRIFANAIITNTHYN